MSDLYNNNGRLRLVIINKSYETPTGISRDSGDRASASEALLLVRLFAVCEVRAFIADLVWACVFLEKLPDVDQRRVGDVL